MYSVGLPVGDVKDVIETCGAADSSGVDGENITRASTTLPVSSQPTVVDVLDTHHAQWTPHLWNRRNHMHGAMANATQSIDNIIDPCVTAEDQLHPFLLPPCSNPTYAIQPNATTPHTSVTRVTSWSPD